MTYANVQLCCTAVLPAETCAVGMNSHVTECITEFYGVGKAATMFPFCLHVQVLPAARFERHILVASARAGSTLWKPDTAGGQLNLCTALLVEASARLGGTTQYMQQRLQPQQLLQRPAAFAPSPEEHAALGLRAMIWSWRMAGDGLEEYQHKADRVTTQLAVALLNVLASAEPMHAWTAAARKAEQLQAASQAHDESSRTTAAAACSGDSSSSSSDGGGTGLILAAPVVVAAFDAAAALVVDSSGEGGIASCDGQRFSSKAWLLHD